MHPHLEVYCDGTVTYNGEVCETHLDSDGHVMVEDMYVYMAVARLYTDADPCSVWFHHSDGNKQNNYYKNIRWARGAVPVKKQLKKWEYTIEGVKLKSAPQVVHYVSERTGELGTAQAVISACVKGCKYKGYTITRARR